MLYEDETGEVPAEAPSPPVTQSPIDSGHNSHQSSSPPPIFHPLAYRGVVASWPVNWRERWGERANSLEDGGLSWRDAETQAFVEVWNELRRQNTNHSNESAATADTAPI